MMKISRLATLAVVGLLTLTLTSCVQPKTTPEGWVYGGYKQWHPQDGKTTVGRTGTQCYFCERTADEPPPPPPPACPDTPKGVPVDAKGCPLDSDGDGVPDYLDKCPNTPRGVVVDKVGCPIDSDGDGVPDYLDKCPDTPKGAHVNAVGCWVVENLHFDTDKAVIKQIDFPNLDSVIVVLNQNPAMNVEIQGHTDNKGSRKHNQSLSEYRAEAVRRYFIAKGIVAKRLSTVGYGMDRPIADNGTPQGRAMNRRVQLDPLK
ncbi:MAG: OmpA family protein [Magnetococcales bacterium]|nr:OmpA family protein [Magnetococcales bacterium]